MRYLWAVVLAALLITYNFDFRHQRAEVLFFDVGQGDSFILRTPQGKIIMVDGGPDWSVLNGLGRYLGFKSRTIDLLILSHGHDDHLRALPELVERYQLKQVFLPARLNSETGRSLSVALRAKGIAIFYPSTKFCFNLEESCELCLYPPGEKFLNSTDDNDLSLAIHFDCGDLIVSAAGDASGKREQELITQGFSEQTQILKASHHGSATANSEALLNLAKPQLLVISVGINNYGHPDPKLINRAQARGIKIWRTDQQGDGLFYFNNSQLYYVKSWP